NKRRGFMSSSHKRFLTSWQLPRKPSRTAGGESPGAEPRSANMCKRQCIERASSLSSETYVRSPGGIQSRQDREKRGHNFLLANVCYILDLMLIQMRLSAFRAS